MVNHAANRYCDDPNIVKMSHPPIEISRYNVLYACLGPMDLRASWVTICLVRAARAEASTPTARQNN